MQRAAAAALGLGLVLTAGGAWAQPSTPSSALAFDVAGSGEARSEAQGETKVVADIKVEIRQESGKVIKDAFQLDWSEDGTHSIESEGTQHDVELRVDRDGNAKSASVTLAYARGGEDIIAPYTFDVKLKKREVVRIEGGLAIAVTVTPKKVAAAADPDKGKKKKPKLDPGDDDPNDPLGGLD